MMMRSIVTLAIGSAIFGAAVTTQPALGGDLQSTTQAGLTVSFDAKFAGASSDSKGVVEAAFDVFDARTGAKLRGLRPAAWFIAWSGANAPTEAECRDRIGSLVQSSLGWRADADLNGYRIVILGPHAISVVNPLARLGGSNLESVALLPSPPADWAISYDESTAAVSMPEIGALALIDIDRAASVRRVDFGRASRPTSVAAAPDGSVWVALGGANKLAVVNPATAEILRTIPIRGDVSGLAIASDGQTIAALHKDAPYLSLVDAVNGAVVRKLELPGRAKIVQFASASQRYYVLLDSGALASVELGGTLRPSALTEKFSLMSVAPDGRHLALTQPTMGRFVLLDSATDEIVGSAGAIEEPREIAFSERYAYVRGATSDRFALLNMDELRAGRAASMEVSYSSGKQDSDAGSLRSGVAIAPDGKSAFIVNQTDKTLAYYTEGMIAPTGSLSLTELRPLAIKVVNRGLKEFAPGHYKASATLNKPGRYVVPVLIDQPRITHCFEMTTPDFPVVAQEVPSTNITPLFEDIALRPKADLRVRYRISDRRTQRALDGLSDVRILTTDDAGIWQTRRSLQNVGDGAYETTLRLPHEGEYSIYVSIPSRNIGFATSPKVVIRTAVDEMAQRDVKQ
jgi:hypothetical protein